MAQNKEQLNKLLTFIEQLTNETGNEDFVDGLRILVLNKYPVQQITEKHPQLLDEIYELCVEKVARKDAEMFYSNFCMPQLANQLIEDYVKMEHWRRRGNFEEFCLALYQQYEGIVNQIARNQNLNDAFQKLLPYHAYTDGKTFDRPYKNKEYPLAKLIFFGDKIIEASGRPLPEQYAVDKYRAILYLIGYGAKMKSEDYNTYVRSAALFNDLYQIRCKNHRGGIATANQQRIYERVESHSQNYTLLLLGELADFIDRVNLNYIHIDDIYVYSQSLQTKKVTITAQPKVIGKIDLNAINIPKRK